MDQGVHNILKISLAMEYYQVKKNIDLEKYALKNSGSFIKNYQKERKLKVRILLL
jgi:hypothetical protein